MISSIRQVVDRVRRSRLHRRNLRHRSNPQTVWVHIGAPKTGTTLLQNQLLENPDRLSAHSIGYDGEGYWLGVKLAAESPLPAEELKLQQEKWRAQIRRRPESVVILSSESLIGAQNCPWTNSAAVARDLRSILAGFEVKIIFCTRRLDSFYESLYHQFIKEGGALTIEEYQTAYPAERFEWDKLLKGYADCFGADAIRVINFETAIRNPGRYVEYAFGDLGVPLSFDVGEVPRENPSYNELGLQLALRCNPLLNPEEKLKLRGFLQANFPKRSGDKFSVIADEERQRLCRLDEELQDRLKTRFRTA